MLSAENPLPNQVVIDPLQKYGQFLIGVVDIETGV